MKKNIVNYFLEIDKYGIVGILESLKNAGNE